MDITSQQLIDRSRNRLPKIMGIINVTPDSFSDGGQFNTVDTAVQQALSLARQGASIIDIGGESTRPGAARISAQDQISRTAPTIQAIRETLDKHIFNHVSISIDTTLAPVAEAALNAGATFINDISAGTEDPDIIALAAQNDSPICLMHMQGEPGNMQQNPSYQDVTHEVEDYLLERADLAISAGCARHNIFLDPGIGFGKSTAHNLQLLSALPRLVATGYPILLGTSRKSLFNAISPATAKLPENREYATAVTSALAVQLGIKIIRVHDVTANRQAIEIAAAILEAAPQ